MTNARDAAPEGSGTGDDPGSKASWSAGSTEGNAGAAIVSFITSLVAIAALWIGVGDNLAAIGAGAASTLVAIVAGVMGRHRTGRGTTGRRLANVGLAIGVTILVVLVLLAALIAVALGALSGTDGNNLP